MSSFAKLLVADMARSVGFYTALGFVPAHQDEVFTQLRWGEAELWLVRLPPGRALDGARGVGVLVCFRADAPGVDTVAERARAAGAVVSGPTDQPWHTREALVTDPDGYRLNFLQSSWAIQ